MVTQLSLFPSPVTVVSSELPWMRVFPDWIPKVGELAQMHAVILPEYGYCYGDTIRIDSIEGNNVVCHVESQRDANWWKNGTEYRCNINDLWPNIY